MTSLRQGLRTGLRLGRGTADRAVRLAAPLTGRLVDAVAVRARRRPATPATFVPTPRADAHPTAQASGPSPATVAQNIAPRRPAPAPRRAPRPSVPGAKLPPPRPHTS